MTEWQGPLRIPEEMIVYLNPTVYRAAEQAGFDMRYYRVLEPIPMIATRRPMRKMKGGE